MTGPKTNEREGTRAFLRSAPMSAFKVREVLNLIRGEEVGRAAEILEFCERGPAEVVGKILASAVANAAHNDELDPEELFVSACFADESKTQRRMRPRARGRATRIRKRSAHITVIVSRLPEERLARLRVKRAAEQAARRTRRGRGAAPPRARRRPQGGGEVPAPDVAELGVHDHDHEHDHDHDHEHDDDVVEAVEPVEVEELAAEPVEVEELAIEHGAIEPDPADELTSDGEAGEAEGSVE
ncbi:MAG: 50S ribosomal protein L22 [Acidimicrobiales bacterium]